MLMYMTSVQSSSVEQRKSVSTAMCSVPKCQGSFTLNMIQPMMANT